MGYIPLSLAYNQLGMGYKSLYHMTGCWISCNVKFSEMKIHKQNKKLHTNRKEIHLVH